MEKDFFRPTEYAETFSDQPPRPSMRAHDVIRRHLEGEADSETEEMFKDLYIVLAAQDTELVRALAMRVEKQTLSNEEAAFIVVLLGVSAAQGPDLTKLREVFVSLPFSPSDYIEEVGTSHLASSIIDQIKVIVEKCR